MGSIRETTNRLVLQTLTLCISLITPGDCAMLTSLGVNRKHVIAVSHKTQHYFIRRMKHRDIDSENGTTKTIVMMMMGEFGQ